MKYQITKEKLDYLVGKLKDVQSKNEEKIKRLKIYGIVCIAIFIIFILTRNFGFYGFLIFMIGGTVFSLLQRQMQNLALDYKINFKESFIGAIITELLPGAKYKHDKGLPASVFLKNGSGILDFGFSSYKTEDYISGKIDDWQIEVAESEFSRSSGDSKTILFSGQVIRLTLDVKFSSNLIIQSKKLNYRAKHASNHRVRLESLEWEDSFDTYCADPVFARYILNPAVMERIQELKNRYSGLGFSFIENYIIIVWDNGREMWEPILKIHDQNELKQEVLRYLNDWGLILNLIHELEIQREIWSRKQFLSHVK